jgi:hypothetical protein
MLLLSSMFFIGVPLYGFMRPMFPPPGIQLIEHIVAAFKATLPKASDSPPAIG